MVIPPCLANGIEVRYSDSSKHGEGVSESVQAAEMLFQILTRSSEVGCRRTRSVLFASGRSSTAKVVMVIRFDSHIKVRQSL
jgi:hypothetical protein